MFDADPDDFFHLKEDFSIRLDCLQSLPKDIRGIKIFADLIKLGNEVPIEHYESQVV